MRMPRASARSEASRIVGPSASGSEKGMPSSMMSAPPSTAASGELGRLRLADEVDDERGHRRASTSREVLVAAAGEADDDELGVEVERAGERVRALERRDDPLAARRARWKAASASSSVQGR